MFLDHPILTLRLMENFIILKLFLKLFKRLKNSVAKVLGSSILLYLDFRIFIRNSHKS